MIRFGSVQIDPPPEAPSPDTQPRATAAPLSGLSEPDGAALSITLDLPFPPSTNRIWRQAPLVAASRPRGREYRSKEYTDWLNAADMYVISTRQFPKQKIHGPFGCLIDLNRKRGRGDGDNRIKALLDWCQSREIIRNDSDCRYGHLGSGLIPIAAPEGCRLTLWSLT